MTSRRIQNGLASASVLLEAANAAAERAGSGSSTNHGPPSTVPHSGQSLQWQQWDIFNARKERGL